MKRQDNMDKQGDRCATCRSFSSRTGSCMGWCLKHKRGTARGKTCADHTPDIAVEYERVARMASPYQAAPWD